MHQNIDDVFEQACDEFGRTADPDAGSDLDIKTRKLLGSMVADHLRSLLEQLAAGDIVAPEDEESDPS